MRLSFKVISFLTAVFAAVVSPARDGAGKRLQFDSVRIEAGEIGEDELPVYRFPFVNTGDEPVSIVRITVTCGSCMKAACGKKTLLPGERDTLTVNYFPKGHPGKFERRVFVYTDRSGSGPEQVLQLAVTVRMGDDLSGYYPVQLGGIGMKTAKCRFRKGRSETVCLEYLDTRGLAPKMRLATEFLPSCLKASLRTPEEVAGDFGPDDPERGQVGEICISFSADEMPSGKDAVQVPLMIEGLGVKPGEAAIKIYIE